MIVVDASALVVALTDGGADGAATRRRLSESSSLHAPHVIDLEVTSVLRRLERAEDVDRRRAEGALEDLTQLPLVRYPHLALVGRIWELRENLSPYDAAYVALAEGLECPLLTGDRGISRAPGVRCDVQVLL